MGSKIDTIGKIIEHNARSFEERTFLYSGNREVSFRGLDLQVNRLADGFMHMGIKKGDKVCICLPNKPEYLYTWFALSKIGAVMVPLNTAFKAKELSYIIRHSESVAVVCDHSHMDEITQIRGDLGSFELVDASEDSRSGNITLEELSEGRQEESPGLDVKEEDHAVYPYTSGTTGMPKGVMLNHRSYVQTGMSYAQTIGATQNDRIMTPNPLFHINAQCYSTMGSMAAGAGLILAEKFSASRIIEQAERYGATMLVLVLASATILYNKYRDEGRVQNGLRKIIAGGVPKGHYRRFEDLFGVVLQNIYSLTESPLGVMSPGKGGCRDGGVGLPMRPPEGYGDNALKVGDEKGRTCPHGEAGEIIIKNRCLMQGYFKDEDETRAVLKEGFFHTGDRGYLDEDGYLFFIGRGRDVLRKKGHNISAAEVEQVIQEHPRVKEAAVVGEASDYGDDEIKAFVVPLAGMDIQEQEIRDWCSKGLAEFKVPRIIRFIERLPKNAMGRVLKNELKGEA